MLAGHLYLPDNNSDILTNKSGVYTIYEHHQNLNDVNQRQNPINNIYEDFKTNNLLKYPYVSTPSLTIFNNEIVNILVCGIQRSEQQYLNEYLQFDIYPLQDAYISFLLYTPDLAALEYILQNCYSLIINDTSIDLYNDTYIDSPISYDSLFSNHRYYLYKNITYTIRFTFMSSLYYCINNQDLCITNIIFPT